MRRGRVFATRAAVYDNLKEKSLRFLPESSAIKQPDDTLVSYNEELCPAVYALLLSVSLLTIKR